MLHNLQLRDFRCFHSVAVEFVTGSNFIIGPNGTGKTSLLEAACVLLRLQSQRTTTLASAVRKGQRAFAVSGYVDSHLLQLRYSPLRRKVIFDGVEQRNVSEYLRLVRVVSFANQDLELIRGPGEVRRRFLDFIGVQIDPGYRPALRAYERALRSRNALLKSPQPRPQEIAAYTAPLVEAGKFLMQAREHLILRLAPIARASHRSISSNAEDLELEYVPGSEPEFGAHLERAQLQDRRLGLTTVGPHRDELRLNVASLPAAQCASEGQQRTAALALKLAQARIFSEENDAAPLLLIDDIFGELDTARRNALLASLPNESQKLVTATSMDWSEGNLPGPIVKMEALER